MKNYIRTGKGSAESAVSSATSGLNNPSAIIFFADYYIIGDVGRKLKEKYPEAIVVVCEPDAPALYDSFLSGAAVFGLELYPCKADKCVNDGDTLSFGKSEISVIATPGHTLGSAVFYIESENLAFAGDTLFKNSVGRTDLYGGSYPQLMNSLKKLKKLPPETVLICGHGESTTMERELMYNSYLV